MISIRLERFSYRFAEQVLNSKLALKQEVEAILTSEAIEVASLSRPNFNKVLKDSFVARGWHDMWKGKPVIGGDTGGITVQLMLNADVISMPDKWEYPWYAAWDLAFHTVSLSLVDFDFAKEQLLLMLRSLYAHPNGQIPAYEWNFSDVNPPVHAWATLSLYKRERTLGRADLRFLERSFQGLMFPLPWRT